MNVGDNEMASEQTAIEIGAPTDTPEQKNDPVGSSLDTSGNAKQIQIVVTREKPKYKSVPENWNAIPSGRFRKIIGDLEAVLLAISVDGKVTSNPFDWRPTIPTLNAWAKPS